MPTISEMSLCGAILITVIIILRALLINRLPKKAFLFLWAAALLKLLLPFRLPSPISIYHAVGTLFLNGNPEIFGQNTILGNTLLPQAAPDSTAAAPAASPLIMQAQPPLFPGFSGKAANGLLHALSPVMLVWMAGFCFFALYIFIIHLKSRRVYRVSLPLEQPFLKNWSETHRLRRRPVQVRCSDRIESPLTYGILWPVILLPKNMDWEDEEKLGFILTHEMTHVRRFDALTKWLLAAAVCIHWFNPFVWVMYILANRDLELSCDEAVLHRYGPGAKAPYALALVSMEERRSRPAPLAGSFSKSALKERITAIMTSRTITPAAALAAVLITAVTVGVFATSAPAMPAAAGTKPDSQNSAAGKAPDGISPGPEQTAVYANADYVLPTDYPEPSYSRREYDRLADALVFDSWESMSIAEFNRRVYAALYGKDNNGTGVLFLYEKILSEIPDADPLASYYGKTVRSSLTEYSARQQEAYSGKRLDPECSVYFESRDLLESEEQPSSFHMTMYSFSYRILNQDTLTVSERDAFLRELTSRPQTALTQNASESFTRQDFEAALKDIGAAVSDDKIAFTGCSVDQFE